MIFIDATMTLKVGWSVDSIGHYMLLYGSLKIQCHDGYIKFLLYWILHSFCFIQSSVIFQIGRH